MPNQDTFDDIRRYEVRRLFVERYSDEPSGENVLDFNNWLVQNKPELLPTDSGDSYEHLKADLKGLWEE